MAPHTVAAGDTRNVAAVDAAALANADLDGVFMQISSVRAVAEIDDALGDRVAMKDCVQVRVGLLVVPLLEVGTRADVSAAATEALACGLCCSHDSRMS